MGLFPPLEVVQRECSKREREEVSGGSGGQVFEAVAVVVVVAARISIACFYFLFLLLFY